MTRSIQMVFAAGNNAKHTITVRNVKEGLEEGTLVTQVMKDLIEAAVVNASNGNQLTDIISAKVINQTEMPVNIKEF